MNSDFAKSNRTIKEHISTEKLNGYCEVGL
jgi:hypothetical protein